MWSFDGHFRQARPVRKALPMPRFLPLVASVAVAALALLTHPSSALADGPVVPSVPAASVASANVPVASPVRLALTTTSATAMGSLMIVLDVLGIMEKDAPKPNDKTRTATFLSPEPPKTPILYSTVTVAKF
jgi:hypothetical protein